MIDEVFDDEYGDDVDVRGREYSLNEKIYSRACSLLSARTTSNRLNSSPPSLIEKSNVAK